MSVLTSPWASDILVSTDVSATDQYALDVWMRGPFHALGILQPGLAQVGFGSYWEADGGWQMGAALNWNSGLGPVPPSMVFPVKWPGDGKTTPLRSYNGGESPSPMYSCGYYAPTDLPITLQLGPGNVTPSVTAYSFTRSDGYPSNSCEFDQTNYTNTVYPSDQDLGRSLLALSNVIVLIPKYPLMAGASYTASITTNGQTYTWSFTISSSPRLPETSDEPVAR